MKKFLLLCFAFCLGGAIKADVIVNTSLIKGPIKIMNAVNNGPVKSGDSQSRGNFQAFKDCRIPYARTHDAAFSSSYGGEHTVDITAIFPDFSKDVNDPNAYDFTLTDNYLWTIHEAGTGIFFRLGQKIEHSLKKYGIMPPADFKKWAEICEHIICHYNEGWANGVKGNNIEYWEIWNEPDLDWSSGAWKTNPKTWGGSQKQFFEFYEIVANHLNKCFPALKIGGPALCYDEKWADEFLAYMSAHHVALDFFSWHIYAIYPGDIALKAQNMRKLLDKYGYKDTESILDEWNYVKGWTEDFLYSSQVMTSLKGGAFIAAVLNTCQSQPVDMLMYYDARPGTVFNGLFDFVTYAPLEGYYALYAWSKLCNLGKQVEATSSEKDVQVTAATNEKGRTSVFVSRYNENNNVVAKKVVKVNVKGLKDDAELVGHITDSSHRYTEIPLVAKNGIIEIVLESNAFMMIDIR